MGKKSQQQQIKGRKETEPRYDKDANIKGKWEAVSRGHSAGTEAR
jgi:hypothetical protein